MAYNVPLSSINASDGNVTYAQGTVLRVGAGGNVNAAGSMFINQDGTVGIGTSDTVSSVLRVYANNSTDSLRIRQDGTGNSLVVSDTVNDSTPFLIDRNGNVGIGTAIVGAPLQVMGNIRIGNTATTGGIVFSDGTFQATAGGGGGTTTSVPLGQIVAIATNLAMP